MRQRLHSAFVAPTSFPLTTSVRRTAWIALSYAIAVAAAEAGWAASEATGLSPVAGGWVAVTAAMACAWAFVEGTLSGGGPSATGIARREEPDFAPATPSPAPERDEAWLGAPERA